MGYVVIEELRTEIAVEVGGTFTDLIAVAPNGTVRVHKTPTTTPDPSTGSLIGLRAIGIEAARIATLVHGSTIATNSVLERRGARTGVLTTRGFRDVLIIQRHDKKDSYDPFYRRPEPLVSRENILEIDERMSAAGIPISPPRESEVVRAVERLRASHGIESLVIGFMNSYANPNHERVAAEAVRARFPALPLTLSSSVLPKFREYERMSTAVISAYVKPLVDTYLRALSDALAADGFTGALLIMQASGGVVTVRGAREHPELMYLSGPAAGMVGAVVLGESVGVPDLLTFDVGGTSTDIGLVAGGAPSMTTDGEISGLPIALPILDILSVGSGGGSIAWKDQGGMLRVGPRSAGAEPGPACYGRGGTEPTLTDALVVLNVIPPDRFLGGRMILDTRAAATAVDQLGSAFAMHTREAADSILSVAVADVAQATRIVTVQRGHDPRGYTICAYGGAGPLLACLLADELGAEEVIVPPNPGVFSAFGLLMSDYRHDEMRTRIHSIDDWTLPALRQEFVELRSHAATQLERQGVPGGGTTYSCWLDLRYEGQGYELRLDVDDGTLSEDGGLSVIRDGFDQLHHRRYGHAFKARKALVVNLGVTGRRPRRQEWPYSASIHSTQPSCDSRLVYWRGREIAWSFYSREEFYEGYELQGPAVVTESTATTLVPEGWRGRVDPYGNLRLTRIEA
jgi:N-methylhydantoinase A